MAENHQSTIPVIGFIDIDGFECQLWQRQYPHTRNTPCIVVNSSGRVVSVSPEAKKVGVSRATTPTKRMALKVFSGLTVFTKPNEFGKPDTRRTRYGTWELFDSIKNFCSKAPDIVIELASSDEIYLDLSGEVSRGVSRRKSEKNRDFIQLDDCTVWEKASECIHGPFQYRILNHVSGYKGHLARDEERLIFGALFMRALAEHVKISIGLASSSGVAMNRLLAKIAGGLNKPGKTTVLPFKAFGRVSKSVDISAVPGLGGKFGEKLMETLKVTKLQELQLIPFAALQVVCEEEEFTAKVYSWVRGKDNEPITHKSMMESFRCNKPNVPVVSNLSLLEKTLKNLSAEVQSRLREEQERHKRVASSVKVEYLIKTKLVEQSCIESESFPILNPDEVDLIPAKILDKMTAEFNLTATKNAMIVETLSFIVKDFVPMSAKVLNACEKALSDIILSGSGPQELRVKVKIHSPVPKFTDQKFLGYFATYSNTECKTEGLRGHRLIPASNFQDLIGKNLGDYYHESNLIKDHLDYYNFKHKCFLKWLYDFDFVGKLKDGRLEKPDFVGFNGRLSDPMLTPAIRQMADWAIYAMNVGGITFLWDEKKPQTVIRKHDFHGIQFEFLLRQRTNPKPSDRPNEYDHVYAITSTNLREHKLLIVSDIDAENDDGDWTEIKLWNSRNNYARTAKLVKLWMLNSLAGVRNVVIGEKNEEGILTSVQVKTLDEIESVLEWKTDACLDFGNRFLTWVKDHFKVDKPGMVRKFSWVCGKPKILCEVIPNHGNLAVPRIYGPLLEELSSLG